MRRAVRCIAGFLLTGCPPNISTTQAQQVSPYVHPIPISALRLPADSGHFYFADAPMGILARRMADDRARMGNVNRQRRLESDTNRLVNLVTDLSREVRSDRELSPVDLGRRAAEIEKLAHDVQARMKS